MYITNLNPNEIQQIERYPTKKRKNTGINKKIMSLKVILTTIVSHLSYPHTSGRVKFASAFTSTNLSYGLKYKCRAISKSKPLFFAMKKNECSIQRNVHLGATFTSYLKHHFQPYGSTTLYSTKSSSNENDDAKKNTKKPKSKKIKINPNWEKEYDKDALTAAFDEMARKEGFDDSMAVFADDETFEDNFDYDDLDEFEGFDDDDDDYLDFGTDFDDDNEDISDDGVTNSQSKESMASRIAAAKRDIDLGKVTIPDEIDSFARSATKDDLQKIGFRREENPFGYDETPRRDAFKLVTDATICSACGSPFQSKDESKPGYLPSEKYKIQLKLAKIEEMQKLQEKAEAFEWSAEDEIEWLIQTSGGDDVDSDSPQDGPSTSDIDIAGMAEELGLDLAELSKKKTICKRCHGLQNFGTVDEQLRPGYTDEPLLSQEAFRNLLAPIREKKAVIIALIDLFDFSGSVLPELDGIAGENPVLLAANKADLLPPKMGQTRAENWVRRELEYLGVKSLANVGGAVRLVSCKTGFGLSSLMTKARELAEDMDCDIYIVGAANAGKSTMINHILEKNAEKKQQYGKKRPGNTNARKGVVTASPLPGTTLKFIKVDIGGGKSLYDTPGLLVPGTLTQLLTPEELKMVVPKKQVEAITFRVESGKCVLVGGLARVEVIDDSKPFLFTFFVSNDIKLHPTSVHKADDFIAKHAGELLTPPLGDGAKRMAEIGEFETHDLLIDGFGWKEAAADITLRGLGWVAVTGAGIAKVRVTVPKGTGISVRPPLMPFDVWEATARYTGGRSVRKSGRSMSGKRRKGVGRR